MTTCNLLVDLIKWPTGWVLNWANFYKYKHNFFRQNVDRAEMFEGVKGENNHEYSTWPIMMTYYDDLLRWPTLMRRWLYRGTECPDNSKLAVWLLPEKKAFVLLDKLPNTCSIISLTISHCRMLHVPYFWTNLRICHVRFKMTP